MINSQMKKYNYYIFGEKNSYGQPKLSEDIKGSVKMAINLITEAIEENSFYSGAQFIGLTLNKNIDATYVIQYGNEKLKVLYVNPAGRFKQVFMARM